MRELRIYPSRAACIVDLIKLQHHDNVIEGCSFPKERTEFDQQKREILNFDCTHSHQSAPFLTTFVSLHDHLQKQTGNFFYITTNYICSKTNTKRFLGNWKISRCEYIRIST
uniref:Uncharacterized protein n=1 Tax=Panagrellus redivivus TaxID=6233 RepID=A0A7E4UR51_PANRE